METINLKSTRLEKKYTGCGHAFIKRKGEELIDLIYLNGADQELGLRDGMDLMNKGYEFGMCSNYEFVIKERFGNE